jgi:hypothetical protein
MLFAGSLLLAPVLVPSLSQAYESFVCSCQASGPGVERDLKSPLKYCSYNCSCIGIKADRTPVMNIPVKIQNVATTAYSVEKWDHGSQICHGQYTWSPNLDSPAWKYQVKFAPFTVTQEGALIFPERLEIAQGVNEEGKRFSPTAKELATALKAQLSN